MLFYAAIIIAALNAGILLLATVNMLTWPKPKRGNEHTPRVSVLIPARNEESQLAACLESVLQQGQGVFEILVYNDHSTDGTASVIEIFAARDQRIRAITPATLPAGWCGKNFACHRLAHAAGGEWLLFLDADARLEPAAVERLTAEARHYNATFLSAWPGLVLNGFWEKACMPLLNFSVFTLFPAPLSFRDKRPSLGLAHGACLLMNRAAYSRVGGHEAVKGEIFEDTCLARLWRERGEFGVCVDGQTAVRVRMYASLGDIWRGFLKNFYPAFRHELSYWLFLMYHAVLFLLPFMMAPLAAFNLSAAWPWLASAVMVIATRLVMATRFRYPVWTVLLHPFTQTMMLVLGLHSRWRCWIGAGVTWKGRSYGAAAEEVQP